MADKKEGAHVVQKAGPNGYAEPRDRDKAGHRDAGQVYVDRQKETAEKDARSSS